jgi:Tfp pilus assembly protein PilO
MRLDAVGLAVCAALTLGAYAVAIRPLVQHMEAAAAQRRELAERRASIAELEQSAQGIRRQLTDLRHEAELLPLKMESARQINQRLARITDLAGESGLEIHDIQPGTAVNKPRFAIIPIQLAGSGDWRACARFLRSLRQVFPDSGVGTVELVGNPGGGPEALAEFKLGLIWHVEPLAPASPTNPLDKPAVGLAD